MPARSPVSAASSVSRASASASSPGASRSQSRMTATPWIAASRMRKTASAFVPGGKSPASITALNLRGDRFLHVAHEAEPLPVAADPRHGPVEEHQREVLGVRLAELVDPPEARADRVHRIGATGASLAARKQQPESFLRERQEDVVLAGEIAVDGGGAVLDLLGDLPDRHVLIALRDEQLARGVENPRATASRSRSCRSLTPKLAVTSSLSRRSRL